MKPFNLAAALAGKPVVTRDGRKAADIFRRKLIEGPLPYPLLVVLVGDTDAKTYTLAGSYHNHPCNLDLFMASEKKTGWAAIFKTGIGKVVLGSVWPTEVEAETHKNNYTNPHALMFGIGVQKIEWEE